MKKKREVDGVKRDGFNQLKKEKARDREREREGEKGKEEARRILRDTYNATKCCCIV